MLEALNSKKYIHNTSYKTVLPNFRYGEGSLAPLKRDTVSFTGLSPASVYKSSFDYMAADILKGSPKKYVKDASMLSATKIGEMVDRLFKLNMVYGPYQESSPLKISWKSYIPEDVRIYCTDKINDARAGRLKQWQNFLENPMSYEEEKGFEELKNEIMSSKSLRFVIWYAINSELQASNRHIPVPLDLKALDITVKHLKNLEPLFRATNCTHGAFLEIYAHRLRDDLLMQKGLSERPDVWVKIPSIKRDPDNREANVRALEILSYKNWCTRSSLDKAVDALSDGDFHIYLKRDKKTMSWHLLIGMASSKGKIDQIQGCENNNLIPLAELENVKKYIEESGLKCNSGVIDEGPKALQQILIAEKFAEYNSAVDKTLTRALREKDALSIFKILGQKIRFTEAGNYIINRYRPQVLLDDKSGIVVPYSFMGINEDLLLAKVEVIEGDFNLASKNKLFNSGITKFPEKLREVKGKIVCTKEQYETFKDSIDAVAKDSSQIIIR